MKFLYKENCGITERKLESLGKTLFPYIDHILACRESGRYEFSESFINLPTDKVLVEEVIDLVKEKKTNALKYIFLIGIGGSNLGVKALYEAMYEFSHHTPKIFFLDTINSQLLEKARIFIDKTLKNPDECLVVVITKSGKTTETVVNAEIIFSALAKKFGKNKTYEQMVVITDDGSSLWKEAKEKKISTLSIPKIITGRTSVFSSVGLFPMSIVGLGDIEFFLKKIEEMRDCSLSKDIFKNPALLSALVTYCHIIDGKTITNTFFFNRELESMGKWYAQLIAESVGKRHTSNGITERIGITPTTSIGSTDLHSVLQLYIDGPQDKLTTFVWFDGKESEKIPQETEFNLVPAIKGKTSTEVITAIYEATKQAYKKEKLPFMEVVMEDISDLGVFMQFKMMEVIYLAKLLNVNPFNQPAVEYYKKETRRLLEE